MHPLDPKQLWRIVDRLSLLMLSLKTNKPLKPQLSPQVFKKAAAKPNFRASQSQQKQLKKPGGTD